MVHVGDNCSPERTIAVCRTLSTNLCFDWFSLHIRPDKLTFPVCVCLQLFVFTSGIILPYTVYSGIFTPLHLVGSFDLYVLR